MANIDLSTLTPEDFQNASSLVAMNDDEVILVEKPVIENSNVYRVPGEFVTAPYQNITWSLLLTAYRAFEEGKLFLNNHVTFGNVTIFTFDPETGGVFQYSYLELRDGILMAYVVTINAADGIITPQYSTINFPGQ